MENTFEENIFKLEKIIKINNNKIYVTSYRGKINFLYNDQVIYNGVPFQDVVLYKDVIIEKDKVKLLYLKNKIIKSKDNKLSETIPVEQIGYMDFNMFDFGEQTEELDKEQMEEEQTEDEEQIEE